MVFLNPIAEEIKISHLVFGIEIPMVCAYCSPSLNPEIPFKLFREMIKPIKTIELYTIIWDQVNPDMEPKVHNK